MWNPAEVQAENTILRHYKADFKEELYQLN